MKYEEFDKLLVMSLKAQAKYLVPRISSTKRKENFNYCFDFILEEINRGPHYHQYLIEKNEKKYDDCKGMYIETYNLLQERFVTGASRDFVLEKL